VTLDPKNVALHPGGHFSQEWQTKLPAGIPFAEIFEPATWTEVVKLMKTRGKRPARDDLLRVIAADGSYDVTCTIVGINDGYALEFRHGRRPSPVAQVLDDLDALPATGSSADLKERATVLRKRWAAAGISRDDIGAARRAYAKDHHPDAGAADGHRLAAANAVLDHALASMQEAA
jgi:hypothetical protein